MLVQFTVENFLSFHNETTFSMVASSDPQHPSHVTEGPGPKAERVLRGAAIYGANGAGKSNLIRAMEFARDRVLTGTRPGHIIPAHPFRLAPPDEMQRPSRFQFVFRFEGILYEYGFSVDGNRVHDEWLYGTSGEKWAKEKPYFARETAADGATTIDFGSPLVGRSARRRQHMEFLKEGTRPNQLFLTELFERNVEEARPLQSWFRDVLLIVSAEPETTTLTFSVHKDDDFRHFAAGLLEAAGTGIGEVITQEEAVDPRRHLPFMSQRALDELQERTAAGAPDAGWILKGPEGQSQTIVRGNHGGAAVLTMQMEHRASSGRTVCFPLDEESDGTQRLMHLLPAIYDVRMDRQRVLLLDELDRRLHPLLSRLIIAAALQNSGRSQLIFTTHDTNLLDLDLLRRDEIWFVEKDRDGASHLYSLAEFKIRPDMKIEKGYLNGRFGAIPFLGDPERLELTRPESRAGNGANDAAMAEAGL